MEVETLVPKVGSGPFEPTERFRNNKKSKASATR